jgi:hypothetical protein
VTGTGNHVSLTGTGGMALAIPSFQGVLSLETF